jgi:hypothetical protein
MDFFIHLIQKSQTSQPISHRFRAYHYTIGNKLSWEENQIIKAKRAKKAEK